MIPEIRQSDPLEVYEDGSQGTLLEGELAVIGTDGKVNKASDIRGGLVVGVAKMVREGMVVVRGGIFLLANDTGNAITRQDRGSVAYVKDENTVAKTTTSSVPAGIVVDVTSDGVWVDCRPAAMAAAKALVLAPSPN